MNRQKLLRATAIIAWSGFVVAAYFVAQKPFVFQVAEPLLNLVWTFVVSFVVLLNGLSLGLITVRQLIPDRVEDAPLLALACGVGLGELGLLGFVLAAVGASNFFVLLATQILLLGFSAWRGVLKNIFSVIRTAAAEMRSSLSILPRWMRWAIALTVALTFLRTLLPPADAFDALLYHLTMPELWLRDGGLRAYNIPHYWFPGLVEGLYFWGLGLGSETVSHQIHFFYALCVIILIWDWSRRLWDDMAAGWSLILLISMPSLWLLASWAYTDLALIFFGLAMLYTLVRGREQKSTRWWTLSAVCAGMAMGVKYTSFVMPATGVLLIAVWSFPRKRELVVELLKFSLVSALTAVIWYARNWIWMGNPIYPFLFGGRYWDDFRSLWFATPGTGLGWDIGALLLLPLTVTLGYQDINSIDADIGPLLLLALPLALWVLFRKRQNEDSQSPAFTAIGLFALFSAAFWTYGYITTRDLWQTRLLLPAIVPFLIPMAGGIASLRQLDTQTLRLSFIVSILAAITVYINLFDAGLGLIARNPLAIATGTLTKERYLEKYQPGYAFALEAVSQTASNAKVYSLFEPRSYGMTREFQPDTILDNFSHDLYLYQSPEGVLDAWRQQGYTHVLLNRRAAEFVLENPKELASFDTAMDSLRSISKSSDGTYELLEIPAGDP